MENLNDLAIFAKIVETGGFTPAAKALHMSPALVSRRIRQLEQAMGVQLLNRSTRQVILTEAGETLYRECAQALGIIDAARQVVMDLSGNTRGRLRLHASVGIGQRFIADAVVLYKKQNPAVSVDLNISPETVNPIADGYDIAIRTMDVPDASLDCRRYGPLRYRIIAAPHYLERAGRPATPRELAAHECLLLYGRSATTNWPFMDESGKTYTVRVSGSLWSNNSWAIVKAAAEGLGIARVPDYALGEHRDDGKLVSLFEDELPTNHDVIAYYARAPHVPAKIVAFLDCLDAVGFGGHHGAPS